MFNYLISKQVNTKRPFYFLASLWAVICPVIFLLSFFANLGFSIDVVEHGRGMLFGFTSALITGYLAGPRRVLEVIWLVGLWSVTRLVELFSAEHELSLWMYGVYGCHVAFIIAPKFISAKKLRNKLMSPTLAILIGFPVLLVIFNSTSIYQADFVFIFSQLLTMLMFFMGGRIISPMIVKASMKNNYRIPHRVQPNIEGATIALIIFSVVLRALNLDWLAPYNRYLLSGTHAAIALLIVTRIWRWTPTSLSKRNGAIWALLTGYLWMALAQLTLGVNVLQEQVDISSLHLISVGALGLMSSSIMTLAVSKQRQTSTEIYFSFLILISGAVILRYIASWLPDYYRLLLSISVVFWCTTYLLVLKEVLAMKLPEWKLRGR
ncbi:NnrS family protein [Aliikangiella sp. G2MR2-5]|uniref:NnrS family protein n=1 Tax=Aliikangiella sp. G2MR2-5 TaxID=2788943 RepID=UPI0018AB5955|nr:NnrS family protein [Aliikangiella sp. G2MR2-5]